MIDKLVITVYISSCDLPLELNSLAHLSLHWLLAVSIKHSQEISVYFLQGCLLPILIYSGAQVQNLRVIFDFFLHPYIQCKIPYLPPGHNSISIHFSPLPICLVQASIIPTLIIFFHWLCFFPYTSHSLSSCLCISFVPCLICWHSPSTKPSTGM